jgi:hypothetical protein
LKQKDHRDLSSRQTIHHVIEAIQSTIIIIIIIIIEICMDVCMYQPYSSIDPQLQSKSGLGLPHSMTISDIRQIMAF